MTKNRPMVAFLAIALVAAFAAPMTSARAAEQTALDAFKPVIVFGEPVAASPARIVDEAEIVAPTQPAAADAIGGADGPTTVILSDEVNPDDPMAMLQTLDLSEAIAAIDTSDPKAFLDAFGANLDAGIAAAQDLLGDIADSLTVPVGMNEVAKMPSQVTIVIPSKDLRLSVAITNIVSSTDALRLTTYAPTVEPDADAEGIQLRNIASTPVRIEAPTAGTARVVCTANIEVATGGQNRTFTRTIEVPLTVAVDANADGALGEGRLPQALRENIASALEIAAAK